MIKSYDLLQQAGMGIGSTTEAEERTRWAARDKELSAGTEACGRPMAWEESLKLVQRLFLTPGQASSKVVMFAAIDSGNGCSRICTIVAGLLAENVSGSVCLVEGNFRSPSLPSIFGVDNHHGLVDSLRQEGAIRQFAKQVSNDHLWLLSSGSLKKDSLSLLNSDRMKERLAELRREFDYVIIDTPPLTAYADAMVLGQLADGVVLVLEASATRREAALRATEGLRAAKIPVLAAVLNKRMFPIPGALYKRL